MIRLIRNLKSGLVGILLLSCIILPVRSAPNTLEQTIALQELTIQSRDVEIASLKYKLQYKEDTINLRDQQLKDKDSELFWGRVERIVVFAVVVVIGVNRG